jgi:hypothetical protein
MKIDDGEVEIILFSSSLFFVSYFNNVSKYEADVKHNVVSLMLKHEECIL